MYKCSFCIIYKLQPSIPMLEPCMPVGESVVWSVRTESVHRVCIGVCMQSSHALMIGILWCYVKPYVLCNPTGVHVHTNACTPVHTNIHTHTCKQSPLLIPIIWCKDTPPPATILGVSCQTPHVPNRLHYFWSHDAFSNRIHHFAMSTCTQVYVCFIRCYTWGVMGGWRGGMRGCIGWGGEGVGEGWDMVGRAWRKVVYRGCSGGLYVWHACAWSCCHEYTHTCFCLCIKVIASYSE